MSNFYVLPPSYREKPPIEAEPKVPGYVTVGQRLGATAAVAGFGGVAAGEILSIENANLQVKLFIIGAAGSAIALIAASAKNVMERSPF